MNPYKIFCIQYHYPNYTQDTYTYYLLIVIIAVIGILAFFCVAKWETKRRQVNLVYEFDNNGSEYYKEIITAFNKIAQSCLGLYGGRTSRKKKFAWEGITRINGILFNSFSKSSRV